MLSYISIHLFTFPYIYFRLSRIVGRLSRSVSRLSGSVSRLSRRVSRLSRMFCYLGHTVDLMLHLSKRHMAVDLTL